MRFRVVSVAYLVALHVALLAFAVHSLPRSSTPALSERELLVDLVHVPLDRQAPTGAAVFLGDSIMLGLYADHVAPVSVNHGIGGMRSDELLSSMDRYRSLQRASRVVLMIGTNDILAGRDEGLAQRYRAILAKIPAGVPVTVAGVPPIRGMVAKAQAAGEAARDACAARAGCSFVDGFALLSAPGALGSDGVHLTPRGYALLTEALGATLRGPA